MQDSLNIRAVVLAAGKSTRFKTKKSKLTHNICGRPMIVYPLIAIQDLNIPITLVLGYQADVIQKLVENENLKSISFVTQSEQLGTGHAVSCSQNTWVGCDDILIINGDMPLINSALIEKIILKHRENKTDLTFVTAMVLDPESYGRVIVNDGKYNVIEEKDCSEEELQISKVNVGIYVIKRAWLSQNINSITKGQNGEFYITDLIKIASLQSIKIKDFAVPFDFVRGVNTFQELWNAEQIKRSELIKYWMAQGVRFEMAQSIHVDTNVRIGAGSFIGTGVHLLGNTIIEEDCSIEAFSIVENTKIENNTTIHSHSVIQDSTIGKYVHVGPFARLRNNVNIGDNVQVGNFVEVKETKIGNESKVKHLAYIGDATVGKCVNIGAGTITCNYDGTTKFQTIIEDDAFIGSNNTLIAPLNVGKGAYTAGGSTITRSVPAGDLGIGRAVQENKKDYAKKIMNKKKNISVKTEHDSLCNSKLTKVNVNSRSNIKNNTQTDL